MKTPAVGEHIKVSLPGETPWAEVVEIDGDKVKARIANRLFAEMSEHERAQFTKAEFGTARPLPRLHTVKQDDELWFKLVGGAWGEWIVWHEEETDT